MAPLIINPGQDNAATTPSQPVKLYTLLPELYGLVLGYLTREDAKNLRLVNKALNVETSKVFFTNVVVPFTAELYSATKSNTQETNRSGEEKALATANEKLSDGFRIFQSFGGNIKRFALCLEIDEEYLANPPIKTTQEIILTFWGLYRWPKPSYTRFKDLEVIEDTADELECMKTALSHLTKVSELGLCCDPGLGYLTGPERNSLYNPGPHPVFRKWNQDHLMDEDAQPGRSWHKIDRFTETGQPIKPLKLEMLEGMALRAGIPPDQLEDAIDLLLECEGVTLDELELNDLDVLRVEEPRPTTEAQAAAQEEAAATTAAVDGLLPAHIKFRLLPNKLSGPQKEMLQEMEWAHRALIESYVLAIADLARQNRFPHLTKLNIAKIPSSHLSILKSHDFWTSLENLNSVSLAVIPDWRTINKNDDIGTIESVPLSPVEAVSKAFDLLQNYVGVRRNITHLHFEWLGGGEFAPGSNQRDRFVLPAPLCNPDHMVDPQTAMRPKLMLSLPHVAHLSLKNCYAAPHVFMQVIRSMALASLANLELVSVSLTGPPRTTSMNDYQDLASLFFAHPAAGFQFGGGNQGAAPNQNMTPEEHVPGARWRTPRLFSWSGFIEHFTPGRRVQDALNNDGTDVSSTFYGKKHTQLLPPPCLRIERSNGAYRLKTMTFVSCGYVSIKAPFINTVAVSSLPDVVRREQPRTESLRDRELGAYLQATTDGLAGYIVPDIDPVDEGILEKFHGMDVGWGKFPDRVVSSSAADNGYGGTGRFTGALGAPRSDTETRHPDYVVRA
ncbi:F-box domain-containing protein [Plectosphaerella cucumerina]|uniref:F-box domain-containing protein n=1 Tax=Plectosphaerella cucumerina TaxID=40658 RepID=A0A8K0TFX0_9PEZI|nr:F-box domain-containing protein [Plectosphaerella cucumerina]